MALAVAPVGRVEVSESVEGAVADEIEGDLIGALPASAIAHEGEQEVVLLVAFEVAGESVGAVEVFGQLPRAFVVVVFSGEGEFPGVTVFSDGEGVACDDACVSVLTGFNGCKSLGEDVEEAEMGASRAGEVAVLREIGPFTIVDAFNEFGDEAVQIGVTLAVGVGSHVDGHAIDGDEKVGAVVEVESAEEILGGFAASGVLGDDDAGDGFEDFATAERGTGEEIGAAGNPEGRGGGLFEEISGFPDDHDFIETHRAFCEVDLGDWGGE